MWDSVSAGEGGPPRARTSFLPFDKLSGTLEESARQLDEAAHGGMTESRRRGRPAQQHSEAWAARYASRRGPRKGSQRATQCGATGRGRRRSRDSHGRCRRTRRRRANDLDRALRRCDFRQGREILLRRRQFLKGEQDRAHGVLAPGTDQKLHVVVGRVELGHDALAVGCYEDAGGLDTAGRRVADRLFCRRRAFPSRLLGRALVQVDV